MLRKVPMIVLLGSTGTGKTKVLIHFSNDRYFFKFLDQVNFFASYKNF